MSQNRIRGPVLTLAAVVALGGGIWLVNESRKGAPAAASQAPPAVVTTTVAPPPPPPAAPDFPTTADYAGEIPTPAGAITVDIAVDGVEAVSYACRTGSFEVWLRGGAVDGRLDLTSADGGSRLIGRLDGAAVTGTLFVGASSWTFTADQLTPPAVSDARTGSVDVG